MSWAARASVKQGSWWPYWAEWFTARSTGDRVPPPTIGAAERGYPPLCPAPGTYVHQR